jgi:hypothetical protein
MGNELAKKYDMPKVHTASGGHECLWKIYPATTKATGEPVSEAKPLHGVWSQRSREKRLYAHLGLVTSLAPCGDNPQS